MDGNKNPWRTDMLPRQPEPRPELLRGHRNTWLMAIRPRWVEATFAGAKTADARKGAINIHAGDWVYVWRTGGARAPGGIVARAVVRAVNTLHRAHVRETALGQRLLRDALLDDPAQMERFVFAGRKRLVSFIRWSSFVALPCEVTLQMLRGRLSRFTPPMTYYRITERYSLLDAIEALGAASQTH